ncbi:Gfo/Idh/MocA family protein [Loigolactobacillus bifermentans]|uniref:Gfo Idh MocA family oxidoreductase n=1 Tax=Loigolactobacillus bifermentans DSM 20003 TaxID=1423726 RepID=A0A0R1HAT5_9LACO|nr:Gfo/Idh/MocA family oxidoreductase [Loigolactobacillus bifermentans]KRK40167.1 Gfo Idh MocA family oxidoreductase [Loigolactobacillus bifermentans DSM 20003]QGG60912.1 gfo/Idh/MocA family oxidoreductase [Loigolactobacillus bifermentans]
MLRIGIMGVASIAPRFVAGVRASQQAIEVVGVAARDVQRAQAFAAAHQIAHVYPDYQTLVAAPEVDLIYIPLRNREHFAGAKLALENGKHVLLEKPFTLTVAAAESLFALAQQHHCFLMEAQKAVFLPVIQKAQQLIQQGILGEIQSIRSQIGHDGAQRIPWFDDVTVGGGAFRGSAAYPIEVIQTLLDQSVQLVSTQHQAAPGQSDHSAAALLKSPTALIQILITCQITLPSELVLYGTKGYLWLPDFWKSGIGEVHLNDGSVQYLTFPMQSEFTYEIEHAAACIAAGRLTSPVMTPQRTLAATQIIAEFYQREMGENTR